MSVYSLTLASYFPGFEGFCERLTYLCDLFLQPGVLQWMLLYWGWDLSRNRFTEVQWEGQRKIFVSPIIICSCIFSPFLRPLTDSPLLRLPTSTETLNHMKVLLSVFVCCQIVAILYDSILSFNFLGGYYSISYLFYTHLLYFIYLTLILAL